MRARIACALAVSAVLVVSACASGGDADSATADRDATDQRADDDTLADPTSSDDTFAEEAAAMVDEERAGPTGTGASTAPAAPTTLIPNERPGMPPVPDPSNVYAATGVGGLSERATDIPHYVYVPTNDAGDVTVIDQGTFEVVDRYLVGDIAQHVTPSWDLETLYANASGWNQIVPIDPTTGAPGDPIRVDAPYNLYFTPDGARAVVMAERRNRIDFYDPETWTMVSSVDTPCDGPNHADWSIDGQRFIVTCEFSSQLLEMTTDGEVLKVIDIPGGKPQDIRLLPDGSAFYVANMANAEVLILDAVTTEFIGSIPTDEHPHGIYPNRDSSLFYVSNRVGGTVSVVDWRTNTVIDTWVIPDGGSPDMGGVNADGSVLWLSGRYHDEVYAIDTATGELITRIPVPGGPHGLAVWPQPGRYSLGHTGNLR